MTNVRRKLAWYLADADDFIDDITINIPLVRLQEIFGIDHENPMYDCYKVDEKISNILSEYFQHHYDFMKYEYYIEATAI